MGHKCSCKKCKKHKKHSKCKCKCGLVLELTSSTAESSCSTSYSITCSSNDGWRKCGRNNIVYFNDGRNDRRYPIKTNNPQLVWRKKGERIKGAGPV